MSAPTDEPTLCGHYHASGLTCAWEKTICVNEAISENPWHAAKDPRPGHTGLLAWKIQIGDLFDQAGREVRWSYECFSATPTAQPLFADCDNCGSVDHTDYNCPCQCHNLERAERNPESICAACGYPAFQHWEHDAPRELRCPDPDVVGPPQTQVRGNEDRPPELLNAAPSS